MKGTCQRCGGDVGLSLSGYVKYRCKACKLEYDGEMLRSS